MKVPLVDLDAQHRTIQAEIEAGFAVLFEHGRFILGPEVAAFEEEYAAFAGVPHCAGVGNGTDAIELLLRAHGIGAGDEVVIPANTFIATALGILRAGATPIPVDCDPGYLLIDPDRVEAALTPRTRALMAVHLFGQIAPMESLEAIAAKNGLLLLEDAAQCHGATRNGRAAGAFGGGAATSFYPGKNLGAYGDAGAVLTTDREIADRVRALRNYGSEHRYHHPFAGFNSRLDTMQAIVLRAKLRHLAEWNASRRSAAARYDGMLASTERVARPAVLAGNEHVWHIYAVRVPNRDRVLARLQEAGIGAAVHYPVPVHLHGATASLGYRRGDFPVAERAAAELLSLPLFPQITEAQQAFVVENLLAAIGET